MNAIIADRGRGPEIVGTRITVYHVMDYVRADASPDEAAVDLGLTAVQVQAALDYIDEHRATVEVEYEKIMARIRRGNPPGVDALLSKSTAELRERLASRAKCLANAAVESQR